MAQMHLRGSGCKRCAYENRITNIKSFISKATAVHGDQYDYRGVVYKNCIEKVRISCPIHGEFIQSPNRHLNKFGCPRCVPVKEDNSDG